jgi:hypothetical protein
VWKWEENLLYMDVGEGTASPSLSESRHCHHPLITHKLFVFAWSAFNILHLWRRPLLVKNLYLLCRL